ncbi:MAG: hypothetical protein AAFV53_31555 [Myxococcota bacterium]
MLLVVVPAYYMLVLRPLAAMKWSFTHDGRQFFVRAAGRKLPELTVDGSPLSVTPQVSQQSNGPLWTTTEHHFTYDGQSGAILVQRESWRPRKCAVLLNQEQIFNSGTDWTS